MTCGWSWSFHFTASRWSWSFHFTASRWSWSCCFRLFVFLVIFSLGKYLWERNRQNIVIFETRRNIIIILLRDGDEMLLFYWERGRNVIEGRNIIIWNDEILLFLKRTWPNLVIILLRERTKCYYIFLFEKEDEMLIFVKVKYWAKYYYFEK